MACTLDSDDGSESARSQDGEKSPAYSCAMFKEWGSWRYFEEFLSVITLPEYGPVDDRYVQGSSCNDVRKWYDLVAEYWNYLLSRWNYPHHR
jgi:hypothetical protein